MQLTCITVVYSSAFESALLKALSPFEKAYISRSLNRLFDSVNQLFPPGSRDLPTEEELHSTIKTMSRCGTASTTLVLQVNKLLLG